MANIRRCYNENCQYNLYGAYCDILDVVIDANGCCEDFRQKESVTEDGGDEDGC